MKIFLRILILPVIWGIACAQSNPPVQMTPLPAGPWLASPGNMAKWEVSYSYEIDKHNGTKDAAYEALKATDYFSRLPRLVIIERTKPTFSEATTDVAGNVLLRWVNGNTQIIHSPGAAPQLASGVGLHYIDYNQIDFPDVEWVSANTYAGTGVMDQKTCWLFKKPGDSSVAVWIDTSTRLPVLWSRTDETRRFKFMPAPTEALRAPPEIKPLLDQVQRAAQIQARPIPHGG